jgi:hypothetical protein
MVDKVVSFLVPPALDNLARAYASPPDAVALALGDHLRDVKRTLARMRRVCKLWSEDVRKARLWRAVVLVQYGDELRCSHPRGFEHAWLDVFLRKKNADAQVRRRRAAELLLRRQSLARSSLPGRPSPVQCCPLCTCLELPTAPESMEDHMVRAHDAPRKKGSRTAFPTLLDLARRGALF